MLDVSKIRSRFPALTPGVVHADAPGGTQAVDAAIAAMAEHLRRGTANQHGVFAASERVDALCAETRRAVAAFTGGDPDGVVFGPNMTTLTFHLARAVGRDLQEGDEIVCTRLDHDANVTPWVRAAEASGATVRWVDLDPMTGKLRVDELTSLVTERTRVIAFPRASNALGTLVDPAPFVAAARGVGAWTFMDAVHAAPHVPLDRAAEGVDVVACSPYKFFGPHAGLLSADPGLLARLSPDKVRPAPDTGPDRWQTGTASFEAIAGTAAAIGYLRELGMDAVGVHETELTRRFLAGLEGLGHVTLYGPTDPEERTPTFAVTVDGHAPAAVAEHLAGRGIYVWHGHYYAVEPMRALGLLEHGGAVRIGFVHYHGPEDVDRVLEALAELDEDRSVRPADAPAETAETAETADTAHAPTKPPAVVVDLDGTLASNAWRLHHIDAGSKDWQAFFAEMGRDAPVAPLVRLVRWLARDVEIVLMSGRPADHEPTIRRWLDDHGIVYDQLHLRPKGDFRPDTVVKRELLRDRIGDDWDVVLAIDDREQVIEMWREEGLYVLEVQDPGLDPLDGG